MLQPSVLIVDDDDRLRQRLVLAFQKRGFEAAGAENTAQLLQLQDDHLPEWMVVDLCMPGQSGLEVVRAIKKREPSVKIIVLTGYGSIATAVEAIKLGATHYLTKPADVDDIIFGFSKDDSEDACSSMSDAKQIPSLARVEWEHIQRVMIECNQNITQAAKTLGLHRRSLQRKLAKFPTSR